MKRALAIVLATTVACTTSPLGKELARGVAERTTDLQRTAGTLVGNETRRTGNLPLARDLTRREVEHMAALPSTAETLAGREASHLDELSQARGLAAREVRRTGALRTDAEQILTVERGQPPRLGVAFEVLLELWRREADFEAWRRPPPIKP